MRKFISAVAVMLAAVMPFATGSGAVLAEEMDGWCAQAKKASSIVICSDPELRQQAAARNKLFEVARAKLSPDAYKALTDDQSRWIKAYTARCGISIDDPPASMPIPQSVIDCYRRESRARTAYLAARLSEPNPMASAAAPGEPIEPPPSAAEANSPPSLPPCDSPAGEAIIRGGGGGCDLQPSPPPSPAGHTSLAGQKALDAWMKCLGGAADALVEQPETAPTVADAALYSCLNSEIAFSEATVKTGEIGRDGFEKLKLIAKQRVVARVMAIREARQEAVRAAPARPPSEASDRDLEKWVRCTLSAVDALAGQPEPAQTVANAVFGSCLTEQFAYQKSAGLSDRQLEADKAAILAPRVLAQVMAVRAVRAKLRKENPETKPAIDYNRM